MKSRRIGVVMGGSSAERAVSQSSGRAVSRALSNAGHEVVKIDLGADVDPFRRLSKARIDVAFLTLEGQLGEDGCVQGMLEMLGIPYTGSGVLASALCMDKAKAKELLRLHNLPTPPSYLFEGEPTAQKIIECHANFGYPVVVKPRHGGSSAGIARVDDADQLVSAVAAARRRDDSVLVERYIRGREVTVGVLEGRVLGALEVAPKNGVYDHHAKRTPEAAEYYIPARLSPALYRNVLTLAGHAARSLEVSGAVRVDLIVSEGQNEYLLEVNTLPALTPTSLMARIAEAAGYGFLELCEAVLALARLHVQGVQEARPSTVVALPGRDGLDLEGDLEFATG